MALTCGLAEGDGNGVGEDTCPSTSIKSSTVVPIESLTRILILPLEEGGGFGGGGGTGGQAIGMDNPFYSMAMQGIMSGVGGSAFQSGGGGNMGGMGGGGQFGGGGFGGKGGFGNGANGL